MADTETTKHPIDSLESTLAVVLKETGKYFRAARSQDARQIGMAKAAIAQVIPAANLKFHEALDEIEIEILRAKAVFDRDLSSIRMKRAERERAAAGILKARSPKVITKGATPRGSPKDEAKSKPLPMSGRGGEAAAVGDDILDISMIDQEPNQDQPPDQSHANTADAIKTEPFALPQELSQDPDQPKGLAISLPEDPSTSVAKPDPETIDLTPGQPSKEETSTPNENSLQDTADFDSMFNDPNETTEDLDFALAFPTDDAPITTTANDNPLTISNNNNNNNNVNTASLLNASAFENISIPPAPTNTSDPQTQNNTTTNENEDISSLLPGLENYVNDPTTTTTHTNNHNHNHNNTNTFDLTLADMVSSIPLDNKQSLNLPPQPNLPPHPHPHFGEGQGAGGEGQGGGVIESSFEDMFGLDSYMDGTGEDDELGAVGEFDEGLFDGF